MRTSASKNGLRVNAVAGTHVVVLGLDLQDPADCLGFAIERSDPEEGEKYFLSGFKVFPYAKDLYPAGAPVSTREHPVQDFLWQDFTARPGRRYDYRVVPLSGKPKKLVEGGAVTLRVRTEKEWGKTHSVFFNRGIAGSQAYARKWGTDMPSDVADPKVWEWLSRGLKEALLAFAGRAKSKRFGLRAAMYEFQDPDVLGAFRQAFTATGGDVRVVVDLREGKGKPRKKNLAAIDDENLQQTMIVERTATKSAIAHNKFVILLEDDEPVAVWTGSTNVTLGGIYAQSNVGHAVENKRLAQDYLDFWELLAADPENADLRPEVESLSPDPDLLAGPALRAVFSPRSSLAPLEEYAAAAGRAREGVFFTAAFGINALLAARFVKPHAHLVYAVLESLGSHPTTIATSKKVIAAKNNFVAVGGGLPTDLEGGYARWLEELTKLRAVSNVDYIHDKFLLVDPLSDDPLVITGSANFSDASTQDNDENMLVIRGDRRVADIYFGEFMRLFKHYYFRDVVRRTKHRLDAKAGLLEEEPSKWTDKHYRAGNRLTKARELFGGERGW